MLVYFQQDNRWIDMKLNTIWKGSMSPRSKHKMYEDLIINFLQTFCKIFDAVFDGSRKMVSSNMEFSKSRKENGMFLEMTYSFYKF